MTSFNMPATMFLLCVYFAAIPAFSGQFTKSFASYVAPMTRPGGKDAATIKVWTPTSDGKFPVFMFLRGAVDAFDADSVWSPITEYMASRDFIAAHPDYPAGDFCFDPCAKTECELSLGTILGIPKSAVAKISQPDKAKALTKAIDVLCALPKADCSFGVALAGHSEGAHLAIQLATIDARVTAVNPWSYGYFLPPGTSTASSWCEESAFVDTRIPKSKRRMVVGALDPYSSVNQKPTPFMIPFNHSDLKGPQAFSGYQCEGSVPPINCIQPDGSGYYIIAKEDYTPEDTAMLKAKGALDNEAAHEFFSDTLSNPAPGDKLVPSFANGSEPWHMKTMLDWLATAARSTSSPEQVIFM